jgi:hypothetical protein
MRAESLKRVLRFIKDKSIIYPGYYTALVFFLWGLSIWMFSINLRQIFVAIFCFLLVHALTTAIVWIGFMKNEEGKRVKSHLILGLAVLLLTLIIDALLATAL